MGRPIGSSSGRVPAGGYPVLSSQGAGFLAGFIDGEATFSIVKQPRNTNHRCLFGLGVRDDDRPLLIAFAQATRLGTVTVVPARDTSRPQAHWSIAAKSDLLRLTEILDGHPLRSRKLTDYKTWKAALYWWIGGDPTRTHRHRDWEPMVCFKRKLEFERAYRSGENMHAGDHCEVPDHGWMDFLAGFFTAEGSLGIYRNGSSFLPSAQIMLRDDDAALLEGLRRRTGVGKLNNSSARRGNPSTTWAVRRGDGLLRLVEIFDLTPLRGRRSREYAIWREAVIEFTGTASRLAVRRRLADLRSVLAQERDYLSAESRRASASA